jgi:hypothetical protein
MQLFQVLGLTQHGFYIAFVPEFCANRAVKPKRPLRKPAAFSTARWTSYAIAAGSTAAGSIATTEAEIHYSGPVEYTFRGKSTVKSHKFPLSNGVYLIGRINHVQFNGSNYAYFGVYNAAVSNSVRGPGQVSGIFQVAALPGRSVVSAGDFFRGSPFKTMQNGDCISPYWQERGGYYVGFRFNTGAGSQYGWVRIRWDGCTPNDYTTNDFIVKDYAWGDPGDQIKTGQKQLHEDSAQVAPPATRSSDTAPASGSLGLLALGAVGLQAWRRSRRVDERNA